MVSAIRNTIYVTIATLVFNEYLIYYLIQFKVPTAYERFINVTLYKI